MRVLLLSTYELGHQPLGLARPAADLLASGHEVRCTDLAVEHLDEEAICWADLVGISVPMHTATRLGARLAERVRALNPAAHVTFYGLYASLHADVLLGRLGDGAIGGEFEGPLVALADALAGPLPLAPIPGVRTLHHDGGVFLGRQAFRLPRRDLLPTLDRYARVDVGTHQKLAGYVEASRGCAHRCLHCPITPVYAGRLRIVERDVVLEDIEQLVRMGAEHITFGDPDFFNGIKHSLRLVEDLHAAFPSLTYDATIKVEHLLEHRQHLATLARTGCLFVVSAVEAIHDDILAAFQKGHTAADVETALALMAGVGVPLRPTFVAFTPWITLAQYRELLAFVRARGLVRHVDAVQYAIRLLVPRGSSLLGSRWLEGHVGAFDPVTFSYRWQHPDPRMDALQRDVAALVEEATRSEEAPEQILARVEGLADRAAGRDTLPGGRPPDDALALPTAAFVPRLTESWFC
jgi:radical SAM superfamily enzyme YgiQ (UPF0313 family)